MMSAAGDQPQPQSSAMLDHALFFYRLGLTPLPIPEGKKSPAFEWEQYKRDKPLPSDLRRWWAMDSRFGLGFVTGRASQIVVVDCDDPALSVELLERYPTTWVVESPGHKSYHLYYQRPDIERLSNIKLFGGRADLRADGGFIVAPPTIHANGQRYRWVNFQGGLPSPMPDGLLQEITGGREKPKTPTDDVNWLSALLSQGSRAGYRDSDATRLAGYYVGKSMPRDVILSHMRQWFDKTDTDKDFTWSDVEKCVDSVIRSAANRTHSNLTLITGQVDLTTPSIHVSSLRSFVEVHEDRDDDEEVQWLIDGWLPRATTALMVAPPGNYKTWLMMAMGMSVAAGVSLAGEQPGEAKPVLIIQQEDSKQIIKQRLRTVYSSMMRPVEVTQQDNPAEPNNPLVTVAGLGTMPTLDVYTSPKLVHFGDPDSMVLLAELIKTFGYGLVFIDPLYMSADSDSYMAKAAQQMGVLKTLRDAYATSFVVLHHTKKASSEFGVERSDAWGSQFINAWLETGIQLRPYIAETIKVLLHSKYTKSQTTRLLRFDINTDPKERTFKIHDEGLAPEVEESGQHEDKQPKKGGKFSRVVSDKTLIDIFLKFDESLPLETIRQELEEGYSIKVSDATIKNRLKQLTEQGKVVLHGDKTYTLLTP